MKTSRPLFAGAAAALFVLLAWAVFAQDPAPAPARPETPAAEPAPSAPAAPAAADPAPAATPAPAAQPAPAAEPASAAEAAGTTGEPPLRRIDEPDTKQPAARKARRGGRSSGGDMPMGDHRVSRESRKHEVVSIMGSSTVEGEVTTDAVSVLGNTTIGPDAIVGGAAVAVMGKLDVQGQVKQEAVGVLGGVNIDGTVGGEAVSVLGNMRLGPNAVVNGDLVVVGGTLTKEPGAVVNGDEVKVPLLGGFGDMEWLTTWFKRCLLLGRPLAFGDHLGWAWAVALSFLALYVVLALLFPRGIDRCVETLETRPGSSIIASMLVVLLTPVVVVLLVFTVVGALLVPFLVVGLFFAGLFGKAVMLAWLGRRVGGLFGGEAVAAAVGVLIGGTLVLAIYVVPFLGFLVYKVLSWLGIGVVVYTIALRMKREKPARPPAAPGFTTAPVPAPPPPVGAGAALGVAAEPTVAAAGAAAGSVPPTVFSTGGTLPEATSGFAGSSATAAAAAVPFAAPPPPSLPAVSAVTLPRATFMLRMGALLLDVILVALMVGFLSNLLPRGLHFRGGPPGIIMALALYGAILWKMKGTTVGGIICGLKVVRLDGREIDWATAIVRALGCFLSLVVVGLGFIWIAIDDDRQGWHDKIAGTVVVRVPKGVSLI